jgi:hypothetical protein
MSSPQDPSNRPAPDDADLGGSREERLSRLDQLEREIADERNRLNRPEEDDQQPARSGDPTDERTGSVRRVDLPELEEKVTESQREAWALGYQAGVADSQNRTGEQTQNPFHPLRGL